MDKLSQIIQNYIGSYPADKSCSTWNEMQSKMEEEINAFFATPSTVESPFSKDELEVIIGAMEIGHSANRITREVIHAKANHLLTNANEFPKQMLVGDHNPPTIDANVVYIDPQQRFVVVQTEMNYEAYMYFAPIEQKPKELKDVKADEYVWCVKNNSMGSFGEKIQVTKVENDLIYLDVVSRVQWIGKNNLMFQAYPPTSAQITAAEEAAINEVKARFEGLRKVNNTEEKEKCDVCGKESDELLACEKCSNNYCEKCHSIYNDFTQIDYNCCKPCSERNHE